VLNEESGAAPKPDEGVDCRIHRLLCRRTGRWLALEEHARCPYCYGREAGLATGQHERFCDFVPGRDPVHFGFPPDTSREQRG